MKQLLLLTILFCFLTYVYASDSCVRVIEQDREDSTVYHLIIKDKAMYFCDANTMKLDDSCPLIFAKAPQKEIYSEDEYRADIFYNSMAYVNELGLYFDKDNLAYDYAHSLSGVLNIAKNELNLPLDFKRVDVPWMTSKRFSLDFTKTDYSVGAYPRGLLIPISTVFVNDILRYVGIEMAENKVTNIDFQTQEGQWFYYRLSYEGDKLIKSEIMVKNKQTLQIESEITKVYHYFDCQP